jgi:hypothetical protein
MLNVKCCEAFHSGECMKEIINNNHLKMEADKELSTLRDHFAGLAMQGLISKSLDVEFIVGMSYVYADAMMKERVK